MYIISDKIQAQTVNNIVEKYHTIQRIIIYLRDKTVLNKICFSITFFCLSNTSNMLMLKK